MPIRRHPPELKSILPQRVAASHKGSYGHLLIIAGSDKYTGAAALMVEAALRVGVGIVYVVATNFTAEVIRTRSPEAVVIPVSDFNTMAIKTIASTIEKFKISAIGIGPGLGEFESEREFYDGITNIIQSTNVPVLVDADALAPIYERMKRFSIQKSNQVIFTPHPKEFLRMIKSESFTSIEKAVMNAASKIEQVIVYKSHQSFVADQANCWYSTSGNAALATAGSGDVLAGIISGCLAQGISGFKAAQFSVYLHGLIGEIVSNDLGLHSLLARDLCDNIAKGLLELERYYE
tara:strand:- start:122 stop:997 length:876 start_codon:yes stop_codon:yes gene_type:complete